MTPEQIFHIYEGLCPDKVEPDQLDPQCSACRLLMDYERLTAGLGELERRWRNLAEKQVGQRTAQKMIMFTDELAALRGNDAD